MTVFAAANDFGTQLARGGIPVDQTLAIQRLPLPYGSSVIFPETTAKFQVWKVLSVPFLIDMAEVREPTDR